LGKRKKERRKEEKKKKRRIIIPIQRDDDETANGQTGKPPHYILAYLATVYESIFGEEERKVLKTAREVKWKKWHVINMTTRPSSISSHSTGRERIITHHPQHSSETSEQPLRHPS
jgi:hypothetical protein